MAKYINKRFLSAFALCTGVGAASGFAVYSFFERSEKEALINRSLEEGYYKVFENRQPKWDSNWDK